MALSYIYEYVRKLIKRMRAQKQTVTKMSFLKKHLRARISVYVKRTSMKNFFNSHFYSQSSKRQYMCCSTQELLLKLNCKRRDKLLSWDEMP